MARPDVPLMFIKPRTALCGPGEILMPKAVNDQLDFETECVPSRILSNTRDLIAALQVGSHHWQGCARCTTKRSTQLCIGVSPFGVSVIVVDPEPCSTDMQVRTTSQHGGSNLLPRKSTMGKALTILAR